MPRMPVAPIVDDEGDVRQSLDLLANVHDALVTAPPSRTAHAPADAQRILRRETGAEAWDPAIVAAVLARPLA